MCVSVHACVMLRKIPPHTHFSEMISTGLPPPTKLVWLISRLQALPTCASQCWDYMPELVSMWPVAQTQVVRLGKQELH